MTPDLLILQFNFFIQGTSKKQSNLWACWLLLNSLGKWTLSTNTGTHTNLSTTPCTNTWSSRWGGVFNPQIHCHKSNSTPSCPARLSQWKAQASGTLIAIYRASHARRGASTERPLFCNSLLLPLYYTGTELVTVEDVTYVLHHSLWVDVTHIIPVLQTHNLAIRLCPHSSRGNCDTKCCFLIIIFCHIYIIDRRLKN